MTCGKKANILTSKWARLLNYYQQLQKLFPFVFPLNWWKRFLLILKWLNCKTTEPVVWRCVCRKGVLRTFSKFTGKYLCHILFFNKSYRVSFLIRLKKKNCLFPSERPGEVFFPTMRPVNFFRNNKWIQKY